MRIGLHFLVVAGAVPAASYDSSGVMTTEMYKYAAKNYNNGTGEGVLIYLGNFSTTYRRGYYFIAGYISDYPLLAYIHYSIRGAINSITKKIVYLDGKDSNIISKSLKLYLKDGNLYLLTSNKDKASSYTIISNQKVEQTDLVLDETYEDVTPEYITP